jgi:hypothetical protein
MVPADRFFNATPAVLESLKQRVADNALELARHGVPKTPLYLTGNVGGTPVVLHAEGDRVILSKDGARAEVDFDPRPAQPMPSPTSAPGPIPTSAPADTTDPVDAMPPPATPVAQISSGWSGAEEQPPGASALDGEALLGPPEPQFVGGA